MIITVHKYFIKMYEIVKGFNFGLIFEIGINILLIYGFCKLLDVFEKSMRDKILSKDNSSQIVQILPIIRRILKAIVVFIIVASFLQTHGYSVSSLIAGFGITGLAVGLAANSTLANIFGTVSIISDKSFKIGDYIKVNGYEGIVEDINMRSTKIRTLDNFLTIIPNSLIANTEIVNVSNGHKRRIFESFGVTYDTSVDKLKEAISILENILKNTPEISKDYTVFLDKLEDSAISIRVNAYVKTKNYAKYLKEKEKFLLAAITRFREANIEFAFPSQSIYIAGESRED